MVKADSVFLTILIWLFCNWSPANTNDFFINTACKKPKILLLHRHNFWLTSVLGRELTSTYFYIRKMETFVFPPDFLFSLLVSSSLFAFSLCFLLMLLSSSSVFTLLFHQSSSASMAFWLLSHTSSLLCAIQPKLLSILNKSIWDFSKCKHRIINNYFKEFISPYAFWYVMCMMKLWFKGSLCLLPTVLDTNYKYHSENTEITQWPAK